MWHPVVLFALSFSIWSANSNGETVHLVQRDVAGHLNRTHIAQRVMLKDKCAPAKHCTPGLLLPVWQPQNNITLGTKLFRALVYLIFMVYLFLGVSIVADRETTEIVIIIINRMAHTQRKAKEKEQEKQSRRAIIYPQYARPFMAAIEVITSQEREVKVRLPSGETTIVLVQVWNKTVSNLTLMALGSSAPEILLSIIEICGNGFEAGDIGPSTIVGSAAFNYFGIIAICITAIPTGQKRRIERIDVFWVTLVWSLFAYIWLYLILCVFSPNVVEVWEGVSTFAFFFLTVINAYIVDRYTPVLQQRILNINKHPVHRHHPKISLRSDHAANEKNNEKTAMKDSAKLQSKDVADAEKALLSDTELQAFQDDRQQFVKIFQKIRREHPNMPLREVGRMVAYRHWVDTPKSRAFRRIQATRKITSGRSLLQLTSAHVIDAFNDNVFDLSEKNGSELLDIAANLNNVVFNFQPSHYICAEDVGYVTLSVKCVRGSQIEIPTIGYVNYQTIDGTAKAGEDYVHLQGTLIFQPDEITKDFSIKIVDNDVYEYDEEFFVRLSKARAVNASNERESVKAMVGAASEALVIIVDDDHAGQFGFRSQVERVTESQGIFHLPVNRQSGARGKVIIPYTIIEGRAKRNVDFRCDDGQLIFYDHQNTATIRIEIINDDLYEKSEEFYVQLGDPIWQEPPRQALENDNMSSADGRPILSTNNRCKVIIKEDDKLKGFVDRLIKHTNCSLAVGTSSWRQQFQEALGVSGEGSDDCIEDMPDDVKDEKPSKFQYIMHYISLPWKLVFAFIPPTDYFHGWVSFVISISLIGVLTALIGDVASMFGCTMGVKDSVTAITLVALGTSVPDTFASKLAAVQDKTADASISNVTGSNAVNVFLGIGVAWALASIYHTYIVGDVFRVQAGSLAASLAVFLLGAVLCTITLQYRRFNSNIAAELGGPTTCKWLAFFIFISMWLLYIVYSILDAYCII